MNGRIDTSDRSSTLSSSSSSTLEGAPVDGQDRHLLAPGDAHTLRAVVDQLAATEQPGLALADGSRLPLPEPLAAVLRDAARALAEGHAVTVAPHHTTLTTQQAAAYLGVSRPTLVKLLEDGALPFSQPGRHRRVRLGDVIAYRDRIRRTRGAALDELAGVSADAGLYADEVSGTRLRR